MILVARRSFPGNVASLAHVYPLGRLSDVQRCGLPSTIFVRMLRRRNRAAKENARNMQARTDKSLDIIGKTLRHTWGDLLSAPLPERICRLLEELERMEKEAVRSPDQQGRDKQR
jgi:hypothetical protein